MNSRIKQLAEQASHQSPDGYPVTIPYSNDFINKFAQLIIEECASICYTSGLEDSDAHAQNLLFEFNINDYINDK